MALGSRRMTFFCRSDSLDHLGTSFKVVLIDSVRRVFRKETKPYDIVIPDFQGLMKQIAMPRSMIPAKLGGSDVMVF